MPHAARTRRMLRFAPLALLLGCALGSLAGPTTAVAAEPVKVGILGVDNYQSVAFTQLYQKPPADNPDLLGMEVVAAWPGGSPDIAESIKGVEQWKERLTAMGVKMEDSPEAVLKQVDAVIIMSLDGRTHLDLATKALAAGKPTYIGRPLAASLTDAIRIFDVAKKYNTPLFSCSQHRFSPGFIGMRNHEEVGKVLGCTVYGGFEGEPHHDGYIWHLHPFETLYTIMGSGAETVTLTQAEAGDVVTGAWKDGRLGSANIIRKGAVKYSAVVFGDRGIAPAGMYGYEAPVKGVVPPKGRYKGYEGVATEIAKFFKTGKLPVEPAETIELFGFMEAAHESGRQGGAPVRVEDVIKKARQTAGN